jgi:alcohol dehydrogenase, propanol-preferring
MSLIISPEKSMRAAVLHNLKEPLKLEEIPTPTIGHDEVLLRVEACGVCHTDLHIAEGDWPQISGLMKRPLVLGHEVVGRVVEAGESVAHLKKGDRVGVPWIYWTCGACEFCRTGNENVCPAQKITGFTVDGGYAEYMKAKATHAMKVPDTLSAEQAAPLFCAGVTVYRGLRRAQIERGQRLAIFGIGGLGHLAVQIASTLGAEVTAIDIADEKLQLARSLGASQTVNAASEDAVGKLRSAGGAHVALVTSASKAAYDMAFYSLRPGGTLVVVGLPAQDLTFPAILMAASEARIISSAVGTRQDLSDVLELAVAGKIHCRVEARPLAEINEIFDDIRQARIAGRVVVA